MECEDVDWTNLVLDKSVWWHFVNVQALKAGYFLTSWVTETFKKGMYSAVG